MIDNTILQIVEGEAARRERLHANHASSRPWSEGYEKVGLAGEFEFGRFCGQMPDLQERAGGDKGVDFRVLLQFTVDVKTARKAYHLSHESGKPLADIYVLAEYDDETGQARLVGWEWGRNLLRAPLKDLGNNGVLGHCIHRSKLRPMSELNEHLFRMEK